jgi:hypothetical protein
MAVVLNVFAPTTLLGGTTGKAYGFTVSATGLGARSYNVGKDGGAFGVPNNTTLNVYELLIAANNQAVGGFLYNGNKSKQSQVAELFGSLNDSGGIF